MTSYPQENQPTAVHSFIGKLPVVLPTQEKEFKAMLLD